MKLDVLIAAQPADVHARSVQLWIEKLGGTCAVDDLSWVNDCTELVSEIGSNGRVVTRFGDYVLDSNTTVWWRRPKTPVTHASVLDGEIQSFVIQEKKHGLHGALHAAGCRFVNEPFAEARANYKPLQLAAAQRAGLAIPRTCVSNSAESAESFLRTLELEGNRCIYKGLTASRYHIAETRTLSIQQLKEQASNLSMAPVIFQEFIEKERDLRIFFAGKNWFAVECFTNHRDLIDWRLDPLIEYRAVENLMPELPGKLALVLSELGLDTGSFDIRINPDGTPVFLEVNPAGQFLFMETDADLQVSEAMAQLLSSQMARDKVVHGELVQTA